MVALVINERRREPRQVPSVHHGDRAPQVLGMPVLEMVDVSAHGLRCRLVKPVRPGRSMPLRLPTAAGTLVVAAFVVRCHVCRLTRHGIQYEAAWAIEDRWPHEY